MTDDDRELEMIRMKKMQEMHNYVHGKEESSDMPSAPVKITDGNFKSTLDKYPLVLVDFWAPWCGPCKMIGPSIEDLAKEYQGKVVFAKLNVDENQLIAQSMQVMGIPTLMLFKDGKLAQRVSGALPKRAIKELVEKHL